jgi:transposase
MLKTVYPNCAGLDVHKKFVTACRMTVDARGRSQAELREFSTMADDLEAMATWLAEGGVTHVATPARTAGAGGEHGRLLATHL